MAVITNFGTLKTAVADWLNRDDDTELTGYIPNFVQNAESRFLRDPRVRDPDGAATRITTLAAGADTGTNWLLTNYPDVYLFGALVESAPFVRDDDRLPIWEAELQRRLDELAGNVRSDPTRSLGLSSYAELQRMVADTLQRGDMENVIPVLITMAEGKLNNDHRVRNLERTTFSVTSDDLAVPTGFRESQSWYHDGDVYYGSIEIVDAGLLGELKIRYGTSGPPKYAAILDGVFRFAPAPSQTYSTKMTYWQGVTALSGGANWLFTNHPHIYMHATLVEAEPWLGRDARVATWKAALEEDLEGLHGRVWSEQWSGTMRRQFYPIG